MRKLKNFAYLGAIALVCAGFISCSSDEEVVDNPNYNPETNEVVTNFVMNFSGARATRTSADVVQATSASQFRGIDRAKLFSFIKSENGKHMYANATFGKVFDLAQVAAPGTLSADNSHRILEMSLPIKSNALVFYGAAPVGTLSSAESSAGYSVKDVFGSIAYDATATNLDGIKLSMEGRLDGSGKYTAYKQMEKLLAGILTSIMNVNFSNATAIEAAASPAGTTVAYGFDVPAADFANIKWSDYANAEKKSPVTTTHGLYPMEEKLASIYSQMTGIQGTDGELRAADGAAILWMVQQIWTAANEIRWSSPISKEEAVAKAFAARIHENIRKFFSASTISENGGPVSGVSFNEIDAIVTALTSTGSDAGYWPTGTPARPTSAEFTDILAATSTEKNPASFPGSFNIPPGGAHVTFANDRFSYPTTFNTSGVGNVSFTVKDYLFPPELLYFGNSPVRTSTVSKSAADYPNTVAEWDDNSNTKWADWTDNKVTSSTRSVAMKYDINYGTALLKTMVGYGASTLKDNNHAVQKRLDPTLADDDELDKEIIVSGTSFKLKGILVGGQSKHIGWTCLPLATQESGESSASIKYGFVYDRAIPTAAQSIPATVGQFSSPNYTMVFDNYISGATQNKVYIALELVNNTGVDFYGNYNLIRNGGTFYLVGCLDPAATTGITGAITWPTTHPVPPYKADGTTDQVVRVFIQDFVTTAMFKFNETSLHSAYLTVPDLRSTSLTLGLNVDLQWENGLTYEVGLGSTY